MGTEELELRPLVKTSEQGSWTGSIPLNSLLTDGRMPDSMIKHGKKAKLPSERWKMNIQPKPNGEKNYLGTPGRSIFQEDLTGKNVYLEFSHDDDAIIYINGIKGSVIQAMLVKRTNG